MHMVVYNATLLWFLVQKLCSATLSISKHIHVFNTELAMHYMAISNMAAFSCFVTEERLCCHVLIHISHDKSKKRPS